MLIKSLIKWMYFKCRYWNLLKFSMATNIGFNSTFEGKNYIAYNTSFVGKMGYGSYIGVGGNLSAVIGRYCSIASCVKTVNGFHPLNFVSMHPAFYNKNNSVNLSYNNIPDQVEEHRYENRYGVYDVEIGNDVWIGAGVTIMAGVKIGDGSVIGSGAMVVKDVPPYSVVAGVPARVIKMRFDQNTIDKLIKLQWWNKEQSWIEKYAVYFTNPTLLFKRLEQDSKEN